MNQLCEIRQQPPYISGFDKTLTPGQLTPLLTPLLTPYEINGKMNTAYLSLNNPF